MIVVDKEAVVAVVGVVPFRPPAQILSAKERGESRHARGHVIGEKWWGYHLIVKSGHKLSLPSHAKTKKLERTSELTYIEIVVVHCVSIFVNVWIVVVVVVIVVQNLSADGSETRGAAGACFVLSDERCVEMRER